MILSCCCAPATVGHDAAAPPRTRRDCRLLMPAPKVYVIVTARMTALVGLKQASRPYEMLGDVRCGSIASFCRPADHFRYSPISGHSQGRSACLKGARRRHRAASFDHLVGTASSEAGMSRPSVFAVLRLMTSSNFVGCSTGRSAGLAPLRILSTKNAARRQAATVLGP
jgi:hypothetical protein